MISVKWSLLLDAFEFMSFDALGERNAFVDLETGALHCVSEEVEMGEETPEDLESSDGYLALPAKNDLGLGKNLALAFVEQELPGDLDRVTAYFHKRGAYSRFKDLLEQRAVLDRWYAFENEATEKALREWCAEHDITIVTEQVT